MKKKLTAAETKKLVKRNIDIQKQISKLGDEYSENYNKLDNLSQADLGGLLFYIYRAGSTTRHNLITGPTLLIKGMIFEMLKTINN